METAKIKELKKLTEDMGISVVNYGAVFLCISFPEKMPETIIDYIDCHFCIITTEDNGVTFKHKKSIIKNE